MNEPKPLYKCDLCGSVDYNDDVRGCLRCGFDEMKPITPSEAATVEPAKVPTFSWDEWRPGIGMSTATMAATHLIDPPDFGEMPMGVTNSMNRKQLWDYANL